MEPSQPSAAGSSHPGPPHPGPTVGGLLNDPVSPDICLRLDQNVFHACEVKQTSLDETGPDFSPGCELGEVRARSMVPRMQGTLGQ